MVNTDKIKQAAELRIKGSSWDEIANDLGYSSGNSAIVNLCSKHPDEWRIEYEQARELYLDGVEAAAISHQMRLMTSARSEHVQQLCGHSLLNHCSRIRATKVEVTGKDGKALGQSDEWIAERTSIIDSLKNHPDAKMSLIESLGGRFTGNGT